MDAERISSRKNKYIAHLRALASDADYRYACAEYLCDGIKLLAEALDKGARVQSVLWKDAAEELPGLDGAKQYIAPAELFDYASPMKNSPGPVFTLAMPEGHSAELHRAVLLENVQDPGNVGTILRTADAAGFTACVLTPGCADPFSPKALRATMGSIFRVPCVQADDAVQTVRTLKTAGYAVLASVLNGEDFYTRRKLPQKVCVIIGNEGAGITPQTAGEATHRFRLPMRGGAESLNAAIAAAILMYEIAQRG